MHLVKLLIKTKLANSLRKHWQKRTITAIGVKNINRSQRDRNRFNGLGNQIPRRNYDRELRWNQIKNTTGTKQYARFSGKYEQIRGKTQYHRGKTQKKLWRSTLEKTLFMIALFLLKFKIFSILRINEYTFNKSHQFPYLLNWQAPKRKQKTLFLDTFYRLKSLQFCSGWFFSDRQIETDNKRSRFSLCRKDHRWKQLQSYFYHWRMPFQHRL